LVRDHRAQQHYLDLAFARLVLGALLGLELGDHARLLEERFLRRQLRVESAQQVFAFSAALGEDLLDETFEDLEWEIVGEVEISQVLAHDIEAQLPVVGGLFALGVLDALA
jgi:hypothetical protein